MAPTSFYSPAHYALIAGHGRSGTNWLLHLLDRATTTHCRNEPNQIAGNAFAALPTPFVSVLDADAFAAPWSRAVTEAARQMGDRDRAVPTRKSHLSAWVQQAGLCDALSRPRVRRVLASAVPAWRGAEWPMPGLRSERAPLAVLKCNQVPGWARYVLERDALAGRVVHIVRHPGGFLHSWRTRYVAERNADEVLRANHARLELVAKASPAFAEVMGEPASHDLDASELWYWRYAIETIDAAGQGAPGAYRRIVFEDLAAEPVGQARALFEWLGLDWTQGIAREVARLSIDSAGIAKRWTDEVGASERATIERVLAGSSLEQWWN